MDSEAEIEEHKRALLIIAAEIGDAALVETLLNAHGSIEVVDDKRRTPLILAAERGHIDVVRFLVGRGADVNRPSFDGTSLTVAVKNNHVEVARILIDHGADVNEERWVKISPLMTAAGYGFTDMVHLLVDHGADVNAGSWSTNTPLCWALLSGHADIVSYLIEHGADVNKTFKPSIKVIDYAAEKGYSDFVEYLVKRGAKVNVADKYGKTALHFAASTKSNIDTVRLLLEHEASVDAADSFGWTSLMSAAKNDNAEIVRLLLDYGADANIVARDDTTALSVATSRGCNGAARILMKHVQYKTHQKHHVEKSLRYAMVISTSCSWELSPFDIEVEQFVDAGHLGAEYLGKWLDTEVVVKLFVSDAANTDFEDKVNLWCTLRHPNVIKLYGACTFRHQCFVCEYAANGSLPEYLERCDESGRTPWKFLYEAALGLEYLHERNIVHGSLRGSNILIGSDHLAKLANFDLRNVVLSYFAIENSNLARWVSPENVRGEEPSFASDVFSLGMCVLEAVTGKVPMSIEQTNLFWRPKRFDELELEIRDIMNENQRELVLAMCRTNPRERVKIEFVVSKLETFAELEAAALEGYEWQPEREPLVDISKFKDGEVDRLWREIQILADPIENRLHKDVVDNLQKVYDIFSLSACSFSNARLFLDVLYKYRAALDAVPGQNRIYRLSATRATVQNMHEVHQQVGRLLSMLNIRDPDRGNHERLWKRHHTNQIEMFISQISQTWLVLNELESKDDRMALHAYLQSELHNHKVHYTTEQLKVLQKACDDIQALSNANIRTAPDWFIPWYELVTTDSAWLGEGGFGSVSKARWLDSEVVVKKMLKADNQDADQKREMRLMFEREVEIWYGLSHPHIVRLFGACHVGTPFFVCEYATQGTLVEYLSKHPTELWTKLREAALGVQCLHSRGIVHGDLKGNNIVIGSDGKAKVTDFGLSGLANDASTMGQVSGAVQWVAPECLIKREPQRPTLASDVYSFGMCIIEALRVVGEEDIQAPWGNLPNAAVKYHACTAKKLPVRPQHCTDEAWNLILRMCAHDPASRIQIVTVVDELEKLELYGYGGMQQPPTHDLVNPLRFSQMSRLISETIDDIDNAGQEDRTKASGRFRRLLAPLLLGSRCRRSSFHAQTEHGDNECFAFIQHVYRLLWRRLGHVFQLMANLRDSGAGVSTQRDEFCILVEHLRKRTMSVLQSSDVGLLLVYTELSLGGYALHRRLDKFMVAHFIPMETGDKIHDWRGSCTDFSAS